MATMKAAVIHEAGGPDVLKIESLPIPTPQNGEVLIRVKAFGLNRSELFTRQGHSPNVKFPRVLGIEAVGVVESAPGTKLDTREESVRVRRTVSRPKTSAANCRPE
jgi:NADPH:quinone reductase-like Zn-dependent oxidoreductase